MEGTNGCSGRGVELAPPKFYGDAVFGFANYDTAGRVVERLDVDIEWIDMRSIFRNGVFEPSDEVGFVFPAQLEPLGLQIIKRDRYSHPRKRSFHTL